MKCLLCSLLLASFCAPSSWSASSVYLVLTQSPDVIIMEGTALNISCCWSGDVERGRVIWMKNNTEIWEYLFSKDPSTGFQQKTTLNCSYLSFSNVTRSHAGRYTCIMNTEIPYGYNVEGSGTEITVIDRKDSLDYSADGETPENNPNTSGTSPVIISLSVVAPLLLVALCCVYVCNLRRKQAKAVLVIYETPHIDSEVSEIDKHSTGSSTGSSQWCQVPVYESFDYFEQTEQNERGK